MIPQESPSESAGVFSIEFAEFAQVFTTPVSPSTLVTGNVILSFWVLPSVTIVVSRIATAPVRVPTLVTGYGGGFPSS